MLVQESDTDAYLLQRILERSFRVSIKRCIDTTNYEQCVTESDYDLVILDNDSSKYDVNSLLALHRTNSIITPTIIVSNEVNDEEYSEFLDSNASDVVLKSQLSTIQFSIKRSHSQYEDRKQLTKALDHLQHSIQEKEILVSEIHHRVKNNLAVVSGLLELSKYQKNVGDQERKNYDDNILRIKTIAIVHEILFREKNMTHVNSSYLLNEILTQVRKYHFLPSMEIDVRKSLYDAILNINQAIPLGLIVTELVTNALKHAFYARSRGTIYLEFSVINKTGHLIIKDDGIGLPPDFNLNNQATFGMTIIQQLLYQLNAELTVESNKDSGTVFKVDFELSEKKGSSNSIHRNSILQSLR